MRNWRATPTLASQAQQELHLPCMPPPLWHRLVPTFSLSVLSHWALLGSLCDSCFCIQSVSLLGKYVPHLPPWSTSSLSSDVYLAVILLLKESLVSWLRFWISVLFPRPPCWICIFSSVSPAVILFSFEFHLYVILKCNVYKSKVLTLRIHNYKEYNL